MSYKKHHEQFVSGNDGTTPLHIAVVGIACIIPVYLRDSIYTLLSKSQKDRLENSIWLSVLMDFFLIILPVELVLTGLSDFGPHCLFAMVLTLWILINIQLSKPKIKKAKTNLAVSEIPMGNRRPFITYYRAYANLITAVSILAVDFKIYPRVFAKTETFGTSVMDVGVGGFLIANAIVSPEARGMVSSDSILSSIWKSIKSSLPLVVIGMVRVVAVKALGYQEVVTEYGVHWNFFFTLAAVKIGCTLLFCSISPRLWSIVGVLTIALYQHSLTYDGLKEYIIKGADGKGGRTDIIDANREGLFSCLGFFSIYIMGVQLGKIIMRKREKVIDWIKLCITLVVMSTAFLVMMYYCEKHVEKVSRRFANLAYLLWVVAFNSLLMLAFLMFDIALFILNHVTRLSRKQESPDGKDTADVAPISEGYSTCDLISAISYNGLFYFMFANLLTGLVNMSMKTIYQSNIVAYLVVTCYMLILSMVSTLLYNRKLCLKFW